MSRTPTAPRFETIGELLDQLGGIEPGRVRATPAPGKATEQDLIRLLARTDRLYELVDGVLVEKVMGAQESFIAGLILYLLHAFNQKRFGFPLGADGAVRLMPGLVRIPDVSFIRWERVPVRGKVPNDAVPNPAPDLAVEVLSESNTPAEMQRKLKEYFLAGTRLVWFVDPQSRTVEVFTAPDQSVTRTEEQSLDGADLLPGLDLPVKSLFEQLEPESPKKSSRKPRLQGKRGKGK
jgi:Uma2 family endonuclease